MGGEDSDKIIRIPGETLLIKVTSEEEKYREKYLPDLKKLTDEKLVCTVCSTSLAQDIHKGKEIYIHRALQVLVCEVCYNFYGDGCFSADEDGDDKYCRWCGQGGTLFLCSKCSCAFCQKCVKQNLKPSVLADLDNDDWKCYICNPRPLFGCRTICWGAQQLNKIGKEKEKERLKKQKERLEKIEAKKRENSDRKSRRVSSSEDEAPPRKRRKDEESDSLSPEVMPKKRSKRESKAPPSSRSLNGSIGRRRKEDSSSDSDEERKITKRSKVISKKDLKNTSSDDSDFRSRKVKLKKNKKKVSSEESTDDDKKKRKQPFNKKVSSDSDSSDEISKKKKQLSKKKRDDTSNTSSDEKSKKKKNFKKKKHSSSDEAECDGRKKKNRKKRKNKGGSSNESSSDDEDGGETKKESKRKQKKEVDYFKKHVDSDNEIKKSTKITTESDEVKIISADDILIKKRVKLAIMWLNSTIKDISELGSLISVRATKFCKKKINPDCLKTYDDVLNTVNKLRQLLIGIHSNYDHIEKTLDSHLKPWKALTGLDEPENEKNLGEISTIASMQTSKLEDTSLKDDDNIAQDKKSDREEENRVNEVEVQDNKSKEDVMEDSLHWSNDTDEECNETKSLISKATKSLDGSQDNEKLCENSLKSPRKKDDESNKGKNNSKEDCKNEESVLQENEPKDYEISQKELSDSDAETSHSKPKIKDSEDSLSPVKSQEYILEEPLQENDSEEEVEKSPVKDSSRKQDTNEGKSTEESDTEDAVIHEETGTKDIGALSEDEHKLKERISSEEDFNIDCFRKKLEEKWSVENQSEMNLKTSPAINSSGDSDYSLENDDNEQEEQVLDQKKCAGKTKLDESEEEQSVETDKSVRRKTRISSVSDEKKTKLKKKIHGDHEGNTDNGKSKEKNISNKELTSMKRKKKRQEESDEIDKKKLIMDCKLKREVTKIAVTKRNKESKFKRNKVKSELSESENSDSGSSKKEENYTSILNQENFKKSKVETSDNNDIELGEDSEEEYSKNKPEGLIKQPLQLADEEVEMKNEENLSSDFTLEIKGSDGQNSNNEVISSDDDGNSEGISAVKLKDDYAKENPSIIEGKDSPNDSDTESIKNKFIGLSSSSEEETDAKKDGDPKKSKTEDEVVKKRKTPKTKLSASLQRRVATILSSDEEEIKEKASESCDEDENKDEVPEAISSEESSGSEIILKSKRKKKGSSDSDGTLSSEENSKKKKKRRRIKCADSSGSGTSGDELNISKKSNQGESPGKGGRKNIKKIKKTDDLEEATKEAAEEEKERRRRIEERQKLFSQVFEIKESAKLEKLVLDFDPETKEELISVHKDLVAKMKPHQAKGVKFMWDCCFESLAQLKKKKGTGCILAHCMGLGKTFQVISLVHTLLTHDETQVHTVMVVCPLSTVLNWYNEFGKWLEDVDGGDEIEVFHLTKFNKNPDRACELRRWKNNGGVLIIGYEMFRNLTNETTKKFKAKVKKDFQETLVDPGADLVVCDEGHMLKNEATALSKAMTKIKTLRRIVLTGTPMQNNLKEYHCMVQFVKPNLLGTSREFLNRFVNPINNGQFVDSTDHDVKLMKRRAHVLHKMLEGLVQRFDYNVLTPFLPPKQEYVISVCLSELQVKLYTHYLENYSQKSDNTKGGTRLFQDWQALGRIWTHPRVLKMSTDKANWLREKKALEESDSEGSLKDFIDDEPEETTEESSDEFSSDDSSKNKKTPIKVGTIRRTRASAQNAALLESSEDEKGEEMREGQEDIKDKGEWWSEFIEPHHMDDINQSGKLVLLFTILKECELIEDKVLVFSQSLFSLDLIEYFLDKIDCATQEGKIDEKLGNHQGTWCRGLDYFRLDGSTSSENRNIWCKAFNREDNSRARLFLISTRAGGLGINLTAANRVIIFDASWNPSHDIQSIFRVYRFGQKKPCYVYRFVAHGTMEEKVYERQVAKQSISNRVVDEQQVHRHFSMNDLNELYTFMPATKLEDRPTPTLPRDPLMAEILSQMRSWIEKYHEHDSLLENVTEEELNEEERKAAWEDYENDKKRGFMPPTGPQGPTPNVNMSSAWNLQIELMRQQMKARYPNKSDEEVNQALIFQVSHIMRQQQMVNQLQGHGNMGYTTQMYNTNAMFNPQMQQYAQTQYPQRKPIVRNILPKPSKQDEYTQQVLRMQQQANLARFQLQQMQAAQKQGNKPQMQSLLQAQLSQQSGSAYKWQAQGQPRANYPTANIMPNVASFQAAELERMKQNYEASRQKKSGVVITEINDSPQSSDRKT